MGQTVHSKYMAYRRDGFPSVRVCSGYVDTEMGLELTRTEVQAEIH